MKNAFAIFGKKSLRNWDYKDKRKERGRGEVASHL
jgi:hypothetical protein